MKKIVKDCISIAHKNLTKHPEFILHGYIHFSFVIQDNKIIEWATNRRSEPMIYWGYPERSSLHSEFFAYKRAKGLLDHSKTFSMVNVRLNRRGELRNSCPCDCCQRYLELLGCNEVWYSTTNAMMRMKEYKI